MKEQSSSTISVVLDLYGHLSRKLKRELRWALILSMLNGLLEVISFYLLVLSLSLISGNATGMEYGQVLVGKFGSDGTELLITSLAILSLSLILRSGTLLYSGQVASRIGSFFTYHSLKSLSARDYMTLKSMPLTDTLEVITVQLSKSHIVLNSLLGIANSSCIAAALCSALALVNPRLALSLVVIITAYYSFSKSALKRRLHRLNRQSYMASQGFQSQVDSLFKSIRQIKMYNEDELFLAPAQTKDLLSRKSMMNARWLSSLPKTTFELIMFLALGAYLAATSSGSTNEGLWLTKSMATIGSIVFMIQRLLPSLQSIFDSWGFVRSNFNILVQICNYIQADSADSNQQVITTGTKSMKLIDNARVEAIDISMERGDDNGYIFEGISFSIKQGQKLGIVGASGSGKSTLLDIVSGLVAPTSGTVLVNGVDIFDGANGQFRESWKRSIGITPQNLQMFSGSLATNICGSKDYDPVSLDRALSSAHLEEVINELGAGIHSIVGQSLNEALSGGQIQRIAIASALYRSHSLILLDEATSGLDPDLEKSVIDSIIDSYKDKTIICVSHRSYPLTCMHQILRVA